MTASGNGNIRILKSPAHDLRMVHVLCVMGRLTVLIIIRTRTCKGWNPLNGYDRHNEKDHNRISKLLLY